MMCIFLGDTQAYLAYGVPENDFKLFSLMQQVLPTFLSFVAYTKIWHMY
jgi:hypothetical protein